MARDFGGERLSAEYYGSILARMIGAISDKKRRSDLKSACDSLLIRLGEQNPAALKAYAETNDVLENMVREVMQLVVPRSATDVQVTVENVARLMETRITSSQIWQTHAHEVRIEIATEEDEERWSRQRGRMARPSNQGVSRVFSAEEVAAYDSLHTMHRNAVSGRRFVEVSRENPVMVFVNPTQESIVFDAMHQYAQESALGQGIHKILDSDEFITTHVEQMNKKVNAAIEKSLKTEGGLKKIDPKEGKDESTKVYKSEEGAVLTQTNNADGTFSFKPDSGFTGVVRVQRRDPQTNRLLKDQMDVVEYKDGEPIAVCMAKEGTSRIRDIGALRDKAMGRERRRGAIKVLSVTEVVDRSGHVSPPQTAGGSQLKQNLQGGVGRK
jgi:hypothetical protein